MHQRARRSTVPQANTHFATYAVVGSDDKLKRLPTRVRTVAAPFKCGIGSTRWICREFIDCRKVDDHASPAWLERRLAFCGLPRTADRWQHRKHFEWRRNVLTFRRCAFEFEEQFCTFSGRIAMLGIVRIGL
jgi:hypothetical protein